MNDKSGIFFTDRRRNVPGGNESKKPIVWKGYKWLVDSYTGNPGSNTFDPTNVYLGSDGVDLKITKVGGVWHCASMVLCGKPEQWNLQVCNPGSSGPARPETWS